MSELKYLQAYDPSVISQVQALIDSDKLAGLILSKYPRATAHDKNAKALYQYAMEIKNKYLRKSTLSKVVYDDKIQVIRDALGLHTYISRVQGNKLKAKNEIRIASLFKRVPIEFLDMILVHELAHFKEKEHNKAFYQLCSHMLPNYHQIEFDLRLYLTHLDRAEPLY